MNMENKTKSFMLTPTEDFYRFIENAHAIPKYYNEHCYTYNEYLGSELNVIYKYKAHRNYNIWRKIDGHKVIIYLLFEFLPKRWHYVVGSFYADDETIKLIQTKAKAEHVAIVGGPHMNGRGFTPYAISYCFKYFE